ncbi:hypothetical protein NW762_013028 [Fusarium torreyae]|uniref:Xylanolytic transcriptional activator regulatory domain-containing protein n=1 Tax=Fusarium torreyae TaxID=1237075 RepID=A0A9W8V7X2_9HYPO|nr:hypothetical protein NW762_013028 [Fusarium torreyae]
MAGLHLQRRRLLNRLANIEALLTMIAGPKPLNPETQQYPEVTLQDLGLPSSAAEWIDPPAQALPEVTNNLCTTFTDSMFKASAVATADQLELAPLPEILPVVDNYFRNYNVIVPLFEETAFMRMLLDWFSFSNERSMVSWAAINVVLAISYRVLEGRPMDDPAYAQCVRNVRSVSTEMMTQVEDLLGFQVLLGLVILYQGSSEIQLALVLIGSVVRLAQSLRLNSKQTLTGLSRAGKLQRCRLFWLYYIYDRELAMRSRSPYNQIDSEMDMECLDPDPEDSLGVISSPTSSIQFNYLRTRAQLAYIQGKAHDLLYNQKSQKLTRDQRITSISRIEDMLAEWTKGIPVELQNAESIKRLLSPTAANILMTMWYRHTECRVKIQSIFTFEDEWITRVSRYLSPAVIEINDDEVDGEVRRASLTPLPPGWTECAQYSRLCLGLLTARQPTEYILWLHTCGSYSCLVILIVNMIEFPDHAYVAQDRELLDNCLAVFKDMTSYLPKEPYEALLHVTIQLDRRARGQVSRAMLAKGEMSFSPSNAELSPSMTWAMLDEIELQ